MAKQHGPIQITGKIGNMVGVRSKNGNFYLRAHYDRPRERWENDPNLEPNRTSARVFGQDSQFVAFIRQRLHPYLELMADTKLHNRLQKLVAEARKFCMPHALKAPLDLRAVAPAFQRCSLKEDLHLSDLFTVTYNADFTQSHTLVIEASAPIRKSLTNQANILRWHFAAIPLTFFEPDAPAAAQECNFQQSGWMPFSKPSSATFKLRHPAFELKDVPILVAVGLECAKGSELRNFPVRNMSVMEILDFF